MSLNLKSINQLLKKPFRYDEYGQIVVDADNNLVVQIRGYGQLSNLTDNDTVCYAQDKLGRDIVDMLNGDYHCECCSIG